MDGKWRKRYDLCALSFGEEIEFGAGNECTGCE